jgi:ABC-2 type transport system permease protein
MQADVTTGVGARNASPLPADELRGPGPLTSRAAKYVAILRMSIGNHLAYWGEVLLRSIFLVLIIFIFVQLWTLTYGSLNTAKVGDYTLPQMIWYFAFAEAIILSVPLLRTKIDQDVKSGDLAYRLNKPYHYVFYLAADYSGERLVRFALNLVIGSILALLFVGPIALTVGGLLAVAVVLPAAMGLDFLVSCAIGLLSFWVEDTWAFDFIYRRLVMILGGMMIPLDVFPEPLSSIARTLPFSLMVYGPARLWVAPTPQFFMEMLVRLAIALAIAGAIVALIYRAGQRNVTVNGG